MWQHDMFDADADAMPTRTGGFVEFSQRVVSKSQKSQKSQRPTRDGHDDRERLRAADDLPPKDPKRENIYPPASGPFDRTRFTYRSHESLVDEIEARYITLQKIYKKLQSRIAVETARGDDYKEKLASTKEVVAELKEELSIVRGQMAAQQDDIQNYERSAQDCQRKNSGHAQELARRDAVINYLFSENVKLIQLTVGAKK